MQLPVVDDPALLAHFVRRVWVLIFHLFRRKAWTAGYFGQRAVKTAVVKTAVVKKVAVKTALKAVTVTRVVRMKVAKMTVVMASPEVLAAAECSQRAICRRLVQTERISR